ncbi:MAG: acyl-CoA synthetase [Rhodobacteraceae bacterium]|nr:acyl-CoA synthetase [Paracoccaceae bacterium]
MSKFRSKADRDRIEAEAPWPVPGLPADVFAMLEGTAARHPRRPALSFQILADPASPAETLDWTAFLARVRQAANLFRALGIGAADAVAYVLPNAPETVVTLVGAMTAGVVCPVNPLLAPEQIAAILRQTGARVVVTLKPFPKTDIPQRVAAALALAPEVRAVLEVDLARHLPIPRRWIVPLVRPRLPARPRVEVEDFARALARQPADRLTFERGSPDRVAARFHTGGTTGMPKLAEHRPAGMVYNGWVGHRMLFSETDVLMCPLPLFHVFAAYPVLMSAIASGGQVVLPTPAGYRGEGVFDNFWKLVERWRATFLMTVPTAVSALMQRPVNADVSSLRSGISGSAPLSVELARRFQTATGLEIAEGYGLTEATCLVSCNPPGGVKKVGSVGIPFPHTEVRILRCDGEGRVLHVCGTDEVGEICVANPGVDPRGIYADPALDRGLLVDGRFLRTGDLGRLDADGYLWITGRAKDLIIRGGHNIDPAMIEEALATHPAVAVAAAIGQPDAFAGELPCAYVELVAGATVTPAALMAHAEATVPEHAAVPKHIEILPELPKTAVGKVFKPALRKRAIARVYDARLAGAGLAARVVEVAEDPRRGLVVRLGPAGGESRAAVASLAGEYALPWEWAE